MLNKESFLKEDVDYNLAFFTIFPAYREKNNGRLAVQSLFKKYQGKWEIKYNKRNIKAKNFWKKVTKDYNVKEIEYDSYSNVLSFSN